MTGECLANRFSLTHRDFAIHARSRHFLILILILIMLVPIVGCQQNETVPRDHSQTEPVQSDSPHPHSLPQDTARVDSGRTDPNEARAQHPQESLPPTAFSASEAENDTPIPTADSSPAESPSQELSFDLQVQQVRLGRSDTIEVSQAIIQDDQLESLRELENLHALILNRGQISDQGVSALTECTQLTRLRLCDSPITNTGFARISQAPQINWLNLPNSELTNDSLADVQKMPQLQMLRLGSPHLSDEGIAALRAHPGLRFVHLIDIPVTDRSLEVFGSLPRLESLYLDGAKITDAGWGAWFAAHPEVHVHLDQLHHDRDPAKH